jgi:hypothetical protein
MIHEHEGIAAGVLEALGVTREKVLPQLIQLLSSGLSDNNMVLYREPAPIATPSVSPAKTTVFISYSHQDREHLLRLQVYLKQHKIAKESFDLPVWDDTQIAVGSDWFAKIKQAVESAVVAVLLVSENFLASDFIDQYELPWLLEAARQGKTLLIPVILSHCAFEDREDLAHIQSINSPNRPLIGLPEPDRGALWNEVARKVRLALQAHQTKSSEPAG